MGYQIVLINSRTGVTEMGGICNCWYQLADVAVLLCAANNQNLDGTREVVSDFRSDAVLSLRNGRALEILVTPARIEQGCDPYKLNEFMDKFEEVFGSDGLPKRLADAGLSYRRLAMPYAPEFAIVERLLKETEIDGTPTRNSQKDIMASFETLTDALLLLCEGEQWAEKKQEALARLRGDTATTSSVADLTRRNAGFDVFIGAARDATDYAQDLLKQLKAADLSVAPIHAHSLVDTHRLIVAIDDQSRSGIFFRIPRPHREFSNQESFSKTFSATPASSASR